eukprot:SM000081S22682  [mRNA]  locus=s81:514736:516573:- [translate_table: standard]
METTTACLRLLHVFAFRANGVLDLNLTRGFAVHSDAARAAPPDLALMGFLLARPPAGLKLRCGSDGGGGGGNSSAAPCVLASTNVSRLFTLRDVVDPSLAYHYFKQKEHQKLLETYCVHTFKILEPDEYYLYFANCEASHLVTIPEIAATFYNQDPTGPLDYLSDGMAPLKYVYIAVAAVFLIASAVWSWRVRKLWSQPASPHGLQVLLSCLLCSTGLLMVSYAVLYAMVQTKGTAGPWQIVNWALLGVQNALQLFAIALLVNRFDPYLSALERLVLPWAVVGLLAVLTVKRVKSSLLHPPLGLQWRDQFLAFKWSLWSIDTLADVCWCLLILMVISYALSWTLKHFCFRHKKQHWGNWMEEEDDDPIRGFLASLIIYAVVTTALVQYLAISVPYSFAWTCFLSQEMAALGVYLCLLYKCRPLLLKSVYQLFDEKDPFDEDMLDDL